jgi:ubiquinone/menaquinone biosynthesis C-methylase UbiE
MQAELPEGVRRKNESARKILRYALAAVALAVVAFLWQQRRSPIPLPPFLTFLIENPLIEAFAGADILLERFDLAPGMKVLDAGCGPGRLTVPVARVMGRTGEVVALDSQTAMLGKLEERTDTEGLTNVRAVRGELGEGALDESGFDRVLLVGVFGEVRDRAAGLRELYAALGPGGVLSVTEILGDPDYHRPPIIRREVEAAGFKLVERFGGFLAYTLNFEKPEG